MTQLARSVRPMAAYVYIDGSLWEEDYDFTEDDYNLLHEYEHFPLYIQQQ